MGVGGNRLTVTFLVGGQPLQVTTCPSTGGEKGTDP